jgi:CubicO group peptidase (beta-lactamase class C family)
MMYMGRREWQEAPYAGGGLFTTPRDITSFAQAILDRGRYGAARILSPAAVAAMTRNQIPGIRARLLNFEAEHASWGYGWAIASPTKWKYFDGSLQPLGTLSHPGAGGAAFWIDPAHEVVGAYFEICTGLTDDYEFLWNFDLFQNAITSAVED